MDCHLVRAVTEEEEEARVASYLITKRARSSETTVRLRYVKSPAEHGRKFARMEWC